MSTELPSILGFFPWINQSASQGVPVTTYHLPDGRRSQQAFDPSSESIRYLALKVIAAGGRFEAEILRNGMVSLTVAAYEGGEELDIACILCRNEYGFIARAFELLVAKAAARMGRKRLERVPYPEFCKHPEKCAGHSQCQSDFVCND
jgi:hypothetical protein